MGSLRKIYSGLEKPDHDHEELKNIAAGAGAAAALGAAIGLVGKLRGGRFALLVAGASLLGAGASYVNEKSRPKETKPKIDKEALAIELQKLPTVSPTINYGIQELAIPEPKLEQKAQPVLPKVEDQVTQAVSNVEEIQAVQPKTEVVRLSEPKLPSIPEESVLTAAQAEELVKEDEQRALESSPFVRAKSF